MTVLSRMLRVNAACCWNHYQMLKLKPGCSAARFSIRNLRHSRSTKRDGGMDLAPDIPYETPRASNMYPGLLKSLLFSVGFCSSVLAGCIIWQYENAKKFLMPKSLNEWAQNQWGRIQGWEHKEGSIRKQMNQWWNEQPDGRKIFWPICFINVLVFLAWHHPSLKLTMYRYFCSSPAAQAVCWPMLLSTFSHYTGLHLAMNMFVLHSFSGSIGKALGKEEYLALYLTGGMISSLASHTCKCFLKSVGPSLGASGAIMAFLSYFCSVFPDAKLGIVFIPGFTFSADSALKGIMCLDTAGIIFRWRLFDHAAHLGGCIWGLLYAYVGHTYLLSKQEFISTKWEALKQNVSSSKP